MNKPDRKVNIIVPDDHVVPVEPELVDEIIEAMALRGARDAYHNRSPGARYWPVASPRGKRTGLGTSTDTPKLTNLPEPVTRLTWDTHGAVDERIAAEACRTAAKAGIGSVCIDAKPSMPYAYDVTSEPRDLTEDPQRFAERVATTHASTRRLELTSHTLREHILIAWPIQTAFGELAKEAADVDTRWIGCKKTQWTAVFTIGPRGAHEIDFFRHDEKGRLVFRTTGRYAHMLMAQRFAAATGLPDED